MLYAHLFSFQQSDKKYFKNDSICKSVESDDTIEQEGLITYSALNK